MELRLPSLGRYLASSALPGWMVDPPDVGVYLSGRAGGSNARWQAECCR